MCPPVFSELLQSLDQCDNDPVAIARCFVMKVTPLLISLLPLYYLTTTYMRYEVLKALSKPPSWYLVLTFLE